MKKIYGIILLITIALWMTACGSVAGDSVSGQSEKAAATISAVSLGQEGEKVLPEAQEFQALLPKDRLTVSAIKYMETTLPEITVEEELPEDITVLAQCSGDIGNDGVNNIAVIFMNSYYKDGEDSYIVAVFKETASGTYRCMEYTEDLISVYEDDEIPPTYHFCGVRVEDGLLKVNNAMQNAEFTNYESVWDLEDDTPVLDEVVVSQISLLTGNGVETTYEMQEGTAICRATSVWNQNVEGRAIYDAIFTPERITMETVDKEYIPTMYEMGCTYAEGGRTYDYHSFGITAEMLEEFPAEDKWKVAYINLLEELMRTDENIQEYRFSLLYIDEDDIPELVYGKSGYWVSAYTYAPGRESLGVKDVVEIMDRWSYGAFGNTGYEYLPGENVLYNHDQNHAGAEHYDVYLKIGSNKEIVEMYYLKMLIYDTNGDLSASGEAGRIEYFYNDEREITEEEYSKYRIDGDFEYIEGYHHGHKIIAELCNTNEWAEPVWKAAYKEVIEAVTKEHATSESAAYELTYDLIYLDDDNIPELVIGQPKGESWVSVYSYTFGKYTEGVENVAVLADEWRYNYGCNLGYRYASGNGRIEEYVELHGNGYYYIDYYMDSYGSLKTGWMYLCEMEFISEAEGYKMTYYRGDELFTQERWDYFMSERQALDWEFLEGTQTYDEIIITLDAM